MKITKTTQSRLTKVDFSNLSFGTVFSDHMLISHYKNDNWEDAEVRPYASIPMFPGTQVFNKGDF